jgi:type IV secretion system protein VirD4
MRGGQILGPDRPRFHHHFVDDLGGDAVDSVATGFQEQLGEPWFMVASWPIYYPPTFWYFYDAYAPKVFTEGDHRGFGRLHRHAVAIGMSVSGATGEECRHLWIGALGGTRRRPVLPRWRPVGPAGSIATISAMMVPSTCCACPTTGKGVGLVVPTLLTWPGSTIIHDIKGENWG